MRLCSEQYSRHSNWVKKKTSGMHVHIAAVLAPAMPTHRPPFGPGPDLPRLY
jgi:hypothetical protein